MTEYNNQNSGDEISLKDLILKFKEYWKELRKNWLFIGLFCIPFLAFLLYKHFKTLPEYKADLTYMLNTNDDNSLAGFASIFGTYGLNKGSSSFSMDKLVEMSKSKTPVTSSLVN